VKSTRLGENPNSKGKGIRVSHDVVLFCSVQWGELKKEVGTGELRGGGDTIKKET